MNIRSAKELGALIRSHRHRRGWTQSDLAKRAGVSALWISQLERGKSTAQFGLVLRTLKELELHLSIAEPGSEESRRTDDDGSAAINLDDLVGGER